MKTPMPFVRRTLLTGMILTLPLAAPAQVVNDMTTPLHLLKPAYKIPYGDLTTEQVKASVDRVFAYISAHTPARLVAGGRPLTDYNTLPENAEVERGSFRIGSYEWGVTYQALLAAWEATGDARYRDYVTERLDFLARVAPDFEQRDGAEIRDAQMEQMLHPRALDDAGAMCTALMKTARLTDREERYRSLIDNYFHFVESGQYRLSDGTFARHRPQRNTVWLDDMYMGLPTVAYRGVYLDKAEGNRYFDEAARVYGGFVKRMFLPEKGLYRHGYVEGLRRQPTYHWARANGWALLTTCELLDMLPADHPQRPFILDCYCRHVDGLVALQSSEGFWHQLLDRGDSYLETSATALYVYAIARGINQGWIDGITYGPVAQLGWHAVNSRITPEGMVDSTCVGTGMAFDPAFYYYRPANAQAAHGYGPVIWAGAEMIRLLDKWHPRTNDSGLHYYSVPQTNPSPLFYLTEDGKGEAVK